MVFIRTTCMCFLSIILLSFSSHAEKLDANAIMDRVAKRFTGHNRSEEIVLTQIDQFGAEKKYTACCFQNHSELTLNSFMVFTSPENVKGTAFLSQDFNDTDKDIQWFYLPALKKTSKMESTARKSSFMGSDFTLNDLNRIYPANYNLKIIDETNVNGYDVWRIESTPKTPEIIAQDGYEKSVYDIRKDIFVIIRSVHWVKGSEELKYYVVKQFKQINDIWVATERQMTVKRDGNIRHKTIIKINNLKFDQVFDEDMFSSDKIKKKSIPVCGGLK